MCLILERRREGDTEREKHQCVAASCAPPRVPACNTGMCPDWESNRQPFDSQAGAQLTESHQPGLVFFIIGQSLPFLSFITVTFLRV